MNIEQAIRERISTLCKEKNAIVPDLNAFDGETTIETIEQFCDQLEISLADFFVNDAFRK